MVSLTQSTKSVKEKDIKRKWYLIDVKNKILGRSAPEITKLLQGKHKSNYVPYLDIGDNVVVINARSVKVTGNKTKSKVYTSYSGYPGGLKTITFEKLQAKKPQELIRHAVSGMLPKNKLRDRRLARLHIFADEKHTFAEKFKHA